MKKINGVGKYTCKLDREGRGMERGDIKGKLFFPQAKGEIKNNFIRVYYRCPKGQRTGSAVATRKPNQHFFFPKWEKKSFCKMHKINWCHFSFHLPPTFFFKARMFHILTEAPDFFQKFILFCYIFGMIVQPFNMICWHSCNRRCNLQKIQKEKNRKNNFSRMPYML